MINNPQPTAIPRLKGRNSLANQTVVKVAAIIIFATIAITIFTYYNLYTSLENQYLSQLEKYIAERSQRERAPFALAQDSQATLKTEVLAQLRLIDSQAVNATEVDREFNSLYVKTAEGITLNDPTTFDGTTQINVFISPRVTLDTLAKRQILAYVKLVEKFGTVLVSRFQDTYIGVREGAVVLYWPASPNWARNTPANYEVSKEEWFYVADFANNPLRKTVWTGVYYDPPSKTWLVSAETPIDWQGQHFLNIGYDVALTELIDRTLNDHLENAYNVVIKRDGRLIAHPKLTEAIKQAGGKFSVANSNNPELQNLYSLIQENIDPTTQTLRKTVLNDSLHNEYIAVSWLKEADWFFITVVSKAVLAQTAFEAARFILLIGIITLLIEIGILWFIFSRQVARPLFELTTATQRLAQGDQSVVLNVNRQDELGQLAKSFNQMVVAVSEREARLANASRVVFKEAHDLRLIANDQAIGSRQQASAISEVQATITELGSTASIIARLAWEVKENAREATQATELIGTTTDLAVSHSSRGQAAVDSTIEMSAETTKLYQELLNRMQELETSSTSMRHILDLLNSIAAETHLLSLNAAIEAAGAGVYGERFGVVAQEVKNLAQRSSLANREAVQIVRKVEDLIHETVTSVEVGYDKTKELSSVAKEAGIVIEDLRKVAEQAEQQANTITEVARHSLTVGEQIETATNQQGNASQEVIFVLSSLSSMAEQSVKDSHTVSTSANGLEQLSKELSTLLVALPKDTTKT